MVTKLKMTDIHDIARRSATYAVLIAMIAAVFFSVEFVTEKFFYNNDEVVDIVSAVAGAFAFSEFRSRFETLTDCVFFRGQYDYSEAVASLDLILRTTIDMKELLGRIADLLAKTIKPEAVAFLLAGSDEPIVYSRLETAPGEVTANIPFLSKGSVVATMLVGRKLSGGDLEAKDMQLLQTISRQAGMALENARLYEALREHSEDLERRVVEKTERIKEMYDAQSKFLTDIAHEFQTPISILKGNLSLLAKIAPTEKAAARSKQAAALYVANTTLDRLSRLVTNLLDIAKLNFSRQKFRKEIIDVGKLLEDAREDCAILAEDKNISISLVSETSFVAGDKDKLKEVLLNLLSNALKHTPGGGSISLTAKHDGENIEIAVVDTGIGIPPENLPNIFERFYKIEDSGNGIGLHLCRQIIEAHSGTIIALSEPGKGSRFVIHLPNKGRDIINACPQL